jgi:hypothetical protein
MEQNVSIFIPMEITESWPIHSIRIQGRIQIDSLTCIEVKYD